MRSIEIATYEMLSNWAELLVGLFQAFVPLFLYQQLELVTSLVHFVKASVHVLHHCFVLCVELFVNCFELMLEFGLECH